VAAYAVAMAVPASVIIGCSVAANDGDLLPTFSYLLATLPTSSPNRRLIETSSLFLVIIEVVVDFELHPLGNRNSQPCLSGPCGRCQT
jgi:hypothetical protein